MTCGIYCIEHVASGKKYIGKSRNIEQRFYAHRYNLKNGDKKHVNRYLYNAVLKHGIDAFCFKVIEVTPFEELPEREIYWMDFFDTCDNSKGYNLRRDSSSGMEVHVDTIRWRSISSYGKRNPNYGNNWSDHQKWRMSEIAKARHSSGQFYGDDWKQKIGQASSHMWSDLDKRAAMAAKVKVNRRKFSFIQKTRGGSLVREWESVEQIIEENPSYKWQNIYSVCNGYKKSYMDFVWEKVPR